MNRTIMLLSLLLAGCNAIDEKKHGSHVNEPEPVADVDQGWLEVAKIAFRGKVIHQVPRGWLHGRQYEEIRFAIAHTLKGIPGMRAITVMHEVDSDHPIVVGAQYWVRLRSVEEGHLESVEGELRGPWLELTGQTQSCDVIRATLDP